LASPVARASLLEGAQFTALVVLPNLVQGLYRRRPRAVRLAVALDVDGRAVRFLTGLRRRHGSGPIWVRVGREHALFVQDPADIHRVLEGSPEPFAPDPPTKRSGMEHFQPDALTISRGALWRDRAHFNAAVLDATQPVHHLAGRFTAVVAEEMDPLIAAGTIEWGAFHETFGRVTRRVIFGDNARDDREVSGLLAELMAEANSFPRTASPRLEQFTGRVRQYVAHAEQGSLVGLFADAPTSADTKPEGQVAHWMFATHDTLGANTFRALALIASHPAGRTDETYLGACLQEAMRLYPTTPILSRVTAEAISWNGEMVREGTVILISNTFNHRDEVSHDFANRFEPEVWLDGRATEDWSFNHFSHGPQACTGGGLAMLLGTSALSSLLARHRFTLVRPTLHADRPLPYMLDLFRIRLRTA
jgi:cytochrome P450